MTGPFPGRSAGSATARGFLMQEINTNISEEIKGNVAEAGDQK
jgi:hypothetical protein